MAGSPPVVTAVTYDQKSYPPGAKITATVTYAPGASVISFTGTGEVTDQATGQEAEGTAQFQISEPDPTKASAFTDTGNRTWTLVSDVSGVATWTATA
jgi:hypothetical protein